MYGHCLGMNQACYMVCVYTQLYYVPVHMPGYRLMTVQETYVRDIYAIAKLTSMNYGKQNKKSFYSICIMNLRQHKNTNIP